MNHIEFHSSKIHNSSARSRSYPCSCRSEEEGGLARCKATLHDIIYFLTL